MPNSIWWAFIPAARRFHQAGSQYVVQDRPGDRRGARRDLPIPGEFGETALPQIAAAARKLPVDEAVRRIIHQFRSHHEGTPWPMMRAWCVWTGVGPLRRLGVGRLPAWRRSGPGRREPAVWARLVAPWPRRCGHAHMPDGRDTWLLELPGLDHTARAGYRTIRRLRSRSVGRTSSASSLWPGWSAAP